MTSHSDSKGGQSILATGTNKDRTRVKRTHSTRSVEVAMEGFLRPLLGGIAQHLMFLFVLFTRAALLLRLSLWEWFIYVCVGLLCRRIIVE